MIESNVLRALHALHKECPKSDDDDVMMMMMMMMTSAGKILSGENSKGLIFSGASRWRPRRELTTQSTGLEFSPL